jgi:hypothetical protein
MAVDTSPPTPRRTDSLSRQTPVMAAPFDPQGSDEMPLTRLVHYWFDEVWCKRNLDAVADIMTSGTVISGAVSALADPNEDYAEVVGAICNLLGSIAITFTHAIETDEWVSVRLLVSTSDPEGNTPFQMTGQIMARVENGKIAEMHSNMDYLRMFEMLGQLPPESLAIFMSGERMK